MIRILHVFHEMANGGVEHFVMDYYRKIDRTRIQFDFLISSATIGYFDDEIHRLGGKVFYAYPLKKNPIKNYYDIARIVKENNYKIVHRHTGSAFGYYDLRAARCGGASRLIMHSHNNNAGNRLLHLWSKFFLKIPCEKVACSKEAGEWLFGEKNDFIVINNAIDCNRFQFHIDTRNKIRSEYQIENKYVIGHVGRFEKQKNHKRILHIFQEVSKKCNGSFLLLVGIGSLQEECQQLAKELGIYEKVLFCGEKSNVNELMQAMDLLLLPSLYEGFPFVLIEAQTSGLPCVASTYVPKECNITGNVFFVGLEQENSVWVENILKSRFSELDRVIYAEKMKEKGYDLCQNAEWLCKYYEDLVK